MKFEEFLNEFLKKWEDDPNYREYKIRYFTDNLELFLFIQVERIQLMIKIDSFKYWTEW
jgi:hypothetical protein